MKNCQFCQSRSSQMAPDVIKGSSGDMKGCRLALLTVSASSVVPHSLGNRNESRSA